MKTPVRGKGYKYISLSYLGVKTNYSVHRLVADAFIPNPEGLPCVNHKDGNKLNNHVDNLEWCDYSYNNHHAYDTDLKSNKTDFNVVWLILDSFYNRDLSKMEIRGLYPEVHKDTVYDIINGRSRKSIRNLFFSTFHHKD